MPRILVAPLNWGLGHATRCLPIAAALRAAGAEVHWASDGAARALLRREEPGAPVHELPGLDVRYPTASALLNVLLAAPGLLRSWRADARALAELHARVGFDAVVSDNRLGARLPGVPSAIVTHQVHLPVRGPAGWVGQALNTRLLRRFGSVVVPDYAGPTEVRLAGPMSAPLDGQRMSYIGPVSRFRRPATVPGGGYRVLVVLSGPEPMRTRLEQAVLRELLGADFGGGQAGYCLVRGLPGAGARAEAPEVAQARAAGMRVVDFLGAAPLAAAMASAQSLVVRPGYTTVMDLAALGRRAVFVPTPGQPEQAWLARALAVSGRGVAVAQSGLVLAKALTALAALEPPPEWDQHPGSTNALARWAASFVSELR